MERGIPLSDINYPAIVLSGADEDALWLKGRLGRENLRVDSSSVLGRALSDTVEFAQQIRGDVPPWDYKRDRDRLVRVATFSPVFRILRKAALSRKEAVERIRHLDADRS